MPRQMSGKNFCKNIWLIWHLARSVIYKSENLKIISRIKTEIRQMDLAQAQPSGARKRLIFKEKNHFARYARYLHKRCMCVSSENKQVYRKSSGNLAYLAREGLRPPRQQGRDGRTRTA
jgi:hypothetical protein